MDYKEHIKIRQLNNGENPPYDLLFLADPSKDTIDAYLKDSDIYVAELGNKILGTYVLYPINPLKIEIKNIAVDTNHQGKGLGKLLLKDALKNAKNKGFEIIIIGTANSSVGQLYLYQRQGFEITDIKKDFF